MHRYLTRGDRTVDQMIQSARSGKQNILEGSKAALTSKEAEIKLTNVARASVEELLDDYCDFLRVRARYERPAEVDLLIGDPTKAKRILEWEPKVRFRELVGDHGRRRHGTARQADCAKASRQNALSKRISHPCMIQNQESTM